jgi:hypothetical protein
VAVDLAARPGRLAEVHGLQQQGLLEQTLDERGDLGAPRERREDRVEVVQRVPDLGERDAVRLGEARDARTARQEALVADALLLPGREDRLLVGRRRGDLLARATSDAQVPRSTTSGTTRKPSRSYAARCSR